jgi:hypothetical protein
MRWKWDTMSEGTHACNGCHAPSGEMGLWDRHGVWHGEADMQHMNADVGDELFNFRGTATGFPYDRLVTISLTANAWDECWCQR